jgi:hypothetical protein
MSDELHEAEAPRGNPFSGGDVLEILRERQWLVGEASAEQMAWCARAAFLLGAQVQDRAGLAELLTLVFYYDAAETLKRMESHLVMSRYAARDVLRQFSLALLDGAPLTPERFSEIITVMKDRMEPRGRDFVTGFGGGLAVCSRGEECAGTGGGVLHLPRLNRLREL